MMTDIPQEAGVWADWLSGLAWVPVAKDEFSRLGKHEQLTRIRHSTAHVMASAIQSLRPDAQFAIGPATPQGFFYDLKTQEPLKEEELAVIEAAMEKVTGKSFPFEVVSVPKGKAIAYFEAFNQPHKLEILARIPDDEVMLYRHGDFVDLCAGPHVPHTGLCRNSKLLGLSAVHWRGEDMPSLTRVAGTAWAKPNELKRYLEFLEDSKARDHRTLGPQLDLFSFHPWAAAPLWHPHGVTLRNQLMTFWREMIQPQDYVEIFNPLIYRKELFECSGHWDHFQENMFIFEGRDEESPTLALKPMNCPDTMLFYKSSLRSYRDLPFRVAEGQILHRNEPTGALHGLMRTRMFIQDDAHIFLTADQVQAEIQALLQMVDQVYASFQLEYSIKLSTRPEDYMGEAALWDQAEAGLKAALEASGKSYTLDEGEGAFYGPKIDIFIEDSLVREWQCGTIQLDFQLPQRFELKYVAADGSYQQPIVVHRAVFGSFERFMGILIEHLGGAFPTWLAPVQVAILPIAERHMDYAQQVKNHLKAQGIRVELEGEESVNYRIRQAETRKIPYMLVMGDREAEAGTVSVRCYHGGQKGAISLADLTAEVMQKVVDRTFDVEVKRYGDLFKEATANVSTEEAVY